jgi:hypothetical protein
MAQRYKQKIQPFKFWLDFNIFIFQEVCLYLLNLVSCLDYVFEYDTIHIPIEGYLHQMRDHLKHCHFVKKIFCDVRVLHPIYHSVHILD